VIKLGTVYSADEPTNVYARKAAESIKARTDGQVEVQVFPDSALGDNVDVLEQALAGAPVIGISNASYLQEYVPDIGVLNGPYLVDDPEEYTKLINSDWYEEIDARLEEQGIKVLAFNWYFGTRHVISDREIRTPEDMRGLKIRIQLSPMYRETFAALGANPTEMEFSEVYSAMSTGVVDAAEAPLTTLYSSKLYEPAPVVSLTGHFKDLSALVMGKEYFDSLPVETQRALVEEFRRFGEEESEAAIDQDAEFREKLEQEGVKIVSDVDTQAFKEETEVVYTRFPEWSPGLYERVQGILEKG
jgi:tripartite ATP-independent transporter DctP family solute receptor